MIEPIARPAAQVVLPSEPVDGAWSIIECAGAPSAPSLSRRASTTEMLAGLQAEASLDSAASAALRLRAARLAVTLPQLLCAVWVGVLSRLTHQPDILIGLEVSSRRTPSLPANLVPLRIPVEPRETFAELAVRVGQRTRKALRYWRFPHAELRRGLGLMPGDPEPLAVTFAFGLRRAASASSLARDIGFAVEPSANAGLLLRLEANRARYTTAETEEALGRLVRVLNQLAASDTVECIALADLELMDPEERRIVTDVFSSGPAAPPSTTLAHLFAAQTLRTPNAVALVAGRDQLTYEMLDAESNRLARELLARGFGPGDVAVLLLPRTARLIVALLACVKVGIVYCPLDPANPRERLEHMVSSCGAKLIVREHIGPVEVGRDLSNVRLDDPGVLAAIAARSADSILEAESRAPVLKDPAYIIFTSGSSGRPKGVIVSNGAIAQQIQAVAREVPMQPGEAALAIFTIAFDVATLDIFLTLSQGASLVLLDEQECRDPDLIVGAVNRYRATTLNATPTLWRTLNVDLLPADLTAMCGGEQFPPDLLPPLSRLRAVLNLYGPTETTVTATLQRIAASDVRDGVIPVGRPLAGYRVWILDADDRPVPIDAVGELCIGGAALAEGYAGEPALTAERFVASPFDGGRMYRTGDLARWRRDGAVDVLGRRDFQVKIHGHRIELGEIEQAIRALPWAADAAVVPVGLGKAMRLVAYVVARPGQTAPCSSKLRAALADRLPEVMRPSACVVLAALPRMPSGKLDRSNLPLPLEESPHESQPPQSAEEALLRLGFARVTGRTGIAGDDDFFEIGGDSLRAMILVSEMRQAGFNLPMELLFSARTPVAISSSWRAANSNHSVTDLRPLVFMLPGAGGDNPGLAKLRANCADSIRFVPLEYPDWPRFARREATIDVIANELAAKMETILPTGPILLAGYSFGAYLAWKLADIFVSRGRVVRGLVFLDAEAVIPPEPSVPRANVLPRLVRLFGMLVQAWRDKEFSQALAENLSWHLTHGRGLIVLRGLAFVRWLPVPKVFRTLLRFYVAREMHAPALLPWYPGWLADRAPSALYPVVLMRAAEPERTETPDLGWGRYFLDLRTTEVAGDHLTMLDRAGPGSLRDRLASAIAALHANAPAEREASALSAL